jgi:CheY-like chemotaxis protein
MRSLAEHVILYVEDDPRSREVLELIMKNVMRLRQFYIFEDSSDFLTRFRSLPIRPDLLLVDIQIAPFSGYDVLDMVRRESGSSTLKVIALTASVTVQEVQALKRAGFDGLIGKPIKGRIFPELITKILNNESVWMV